MKVNIPEKYAELYLKALIEKKEHLLAKIQEFQKEIIDIDNHIGALTSMPIFQEEQLRGPVMWETNKYKKDWSWMKKVICYFDQVNLLSPAKQIVEFILNNEGNTKKVKIRSSVSAALSNGLKTDELLKFSDPHLPITFYGKREWFNSNGIPKMEYIPPELKESMVK